MFLFCIMYFDMARLEAVWIIHFYMDVIYTIEPYVSSITLYLNGIAQSSFGKLRVCFTREKSYELQLAWWHPF